MRNQKEHRCNFVGVSFYFDAYLSSLVLSEGGNDPELNQPWVPSPQPLVKMMPFLSLSGTRVSLSSVWVLGESAPWARFLWTESGMLALTKRALVEGGAVK